MGAGGVGVVGGTVVVVVAPDVVAVVVEVLAVAPVGGAVVPVVGVPVGHVDIFVAFSVAAAEVVCSCRSIDGLRVRVVTGNVHPPGHACEVVDRRGVDCSFCVTFSEDAGASVVSAGSCVEVCVVCWDGDAATRV